MLEAAAKTSAEQRDVDVNVLGLQSNGGGDGIANVLRDLRRRPDLAGGPEEVREAVLRLHGSMRQHGRLIRCLNTTALGAANITRALQRHAFVAGRFAQDVKDGVGVQVLIGTFVPSDF